MAKVSVLKNSKEYWGTFKESYWNEGSKLYPNKLKDRLEEIKGVKDGSLIKVEAERLNDYIKGRGSEYKCFKSSISKVISQKEYDMVVQKTSELLPQSLIQEHQNVFLLMYCYAKAFKKRIDQEEQKVKKVRSLNTISELDRLFVDIANNKDIEIQQISINYLDNNKSKRIVVDTSALLKLMLYGTAQTLYTQFFDIGQFSVVQVSENQTAEEYRWEENIQFRSPKKRLRGRQEQPSSKYLKALTHLFHDFIVEQGILPENTPENQIYRLFGEILSLAELLVYNEALSGYEEDNFHHKRLSKHWKPSRNVNGQM